MTREKAQRTCSLYFAHNPKFAVKSSAKLPSAFDSCFRDLVFVFVKDRVSCRPGQALTCHIAKKDGLLILLPLPPLSTGITGSLLSFSCYHRLTPPCCSVCGGWGSNRGLGTCQRSLLPTELYLKDVHLKSFDYTSLFLSVCPCTSCMYAMVRGQLAGASSCL